MARKTIILHKLLDRNISNEHHLNLADNPPNPNGPPWPLTTPPKPATPPEEPVPPPVSPDVL